MGVGRIISVYSTFFCLTLRGGVGGVGGGVSGSSSIGGVRFRYDINAGEAEREDQGDDVSDVPSLGGNGVAGLLIGWGAISTISISSSSSSDEMMTISVLLFVVALFVLIIGK